MQRNIILLIIMEDKKNIIYTIGHSNQTIESFLEELYSFGINCIVDVRSIPYSKFTPQFNSEALSAVLKKKGIAYLHFGKEFGARRSDAIGENNRVDFELAVKTDAFTNGIRRLNNGLNKGYKIALMCSEANPLECHRFSLVSRYLFENGYNVHHILKTGVETTHQKLLEQMIAEYVQKKKIPEVDLLFVGEFTKEEQIKAAYHIKNEEIGYVFKESLIYD